MRNASRLAPDSSSIGTGDVLDELEQDHRRVESLFARSSLTAGAERVGVIHDIVRELTVHTAVEEQVVYPAIEAQLVGGESLAGRARDEHQEIEHLLAVLGKVDEAAADQRPTVEALRALQFVVQQHVTVEEGEMFPAFRASAGPDAVAELRTPADEARSAGPKAKKSKPKSRKTSGAK